jgi:hypothetical protein
MTEPRLAADFERSPHRRINMDILFIALIALVVLSLGGWGYGNYGYRTVPASGGPVVGPA